eukprot:m.9052 g.9052  ORF g.9052 m.9052 type:complete len:780 (-) comp5418_c0_seq1:3012-5351(-)
MQPVEMVKQHVYVACSDVPGEVEFAQGLATVLQSTLSVRSYKTGADDSLNDAIAHGIEHAAAVLVLCSSDFQDDKGCSKLINYADQRKVPLVHVRINGFQPSSWLGALLAAAPSIDVRSEFDSVNSGQAAVKIYSVVEQAISSMDTVKMEVGEEPMTFVEPFFKGAGRQLDAKYYQFGKGHAMDFELFSLVDGRVIGQGEDDISPFTVAGSYNLSRHTIKFIKQYVGTEKHSVVYRGDLVLKRRKCKVTGIWEIPGVCNGNFDIAFAVESGSEPEQSARTLSFEDGIVVCLLAHPSSTTLVAKIRDALLKEGIKVLVPPHSDKAMLSQGLKSHVVLPVLEQSFQDCKVCKQALTCLEGSKCIISPIMAPQGWQFSGWLGPVCAGKLYTSFADPKGFKGAVKALVSEIHAQLAATQTASLGGAVVSDGGSINGWYAQYGKKDAMKFEAFVMANNQVAGSGGDSVGTFTLSGSYDANGNISFVKQYHGQHSVNYNGTYSVGHQLVVEGSWSIPPSYSGEFMLSSPMAQADRPHVMISYQWNSQEAVKKVVAELEKRDIPVWFDINGDMYGNINQAMAEGVEGSQCIVCFATEDYRKSRNCQKELSYAHQLDKPIVPVLLSEVEATEDWLSMIIASINKVNFRDQSQFEDGMDALCARLDTLVAVKPKSVGTSASAQEQGSFVGGGKAEGYYMQSRQQYPMDFDYFSMSNGRIRGQGDDAVGSFTIAGVYNKDKIDFTKSYIGAHDVRYRGKAVRSADGASMTISGKWSIQSLSDRFEITVT